MEIDINVNWLICFALMVGFFVWNQIKMQKTIDRLENKLMSRDYREYEAVQVEKEAAEVQIDKMKKMEEVEVDIEDADYRKFNNELEEDWAEEELDMDKVKEQLEERNTLKE